MPRPRNVLTIVFDDLRPDLSMYNSSFMHTPHLQALADSGVTFERGYCQQSVCSPSRMSFTTGRRPATTKTWNFLQHFRQATCPISNRELVEGGVPLTGTRRANGVSFNASDGTLGSTGGAGQCCTDCTASDGCVAWELNDATCTLFSSVAHASGVAALQCPSVVSDPSGVPCMRGTKGVFETWTPLPQHLREQGYLTLGVGKYYHDVNKGLGVLNNPMYPGGTGLPPLCDPVSWTNVSVQNVNFSALREQYLPGKFNQIIEGCEYTGGAGFGYVNTMDGCKGKGEEYCSIADAKPDGTGTGPGESVFCDLITYEDAKTKLRYAAVELKRREAEASSVSPAKGFFMAVGIRRPHLTWRAPSAYYDLYPPGDVALPTQSTLDASIDPIAYTHVRFNYLIYVY